MQPGRWRVSDGTRELLDHRLRRLRSADAYLDSRFAPAAVTEGLGAPAGWFLGPKAENQDLLEELIIEAIRDHCKYRVGFHREDPIEITGDERRSKPYLRAVRTLRHQTKILLARLRLSAPFFSMRYQGHMLWDQVMPAMVGYFAAMLYNQNNVAAEASPVTTKLEIEVAKDLCRMLGFHVPRDGADPSSEPGSWGHITCDGTVANIEALWAARNAKFFPVALRAALREAPALARARHLEVQLLDGSRARLIDLDTWVLLNLIVDTVVGLTQRIFDEYHVPVSAVTQAVRPYSVQNIGLVDFYRQFMSDVPQPAVAIVPSTAHYSWPKAGALLGLGRENILRVHVDLQARMEVAHLVDTLQGCLQKRVPVIAVVAVIGSTEESAVDPLVAILDVREQYRRQGLDFAIHCDAAWGGYFRSMLRGDTPEATAQIASIPVIEMSGYVREQYEALRKADSVTVDSHKAGYVPYPAGSVCYRNSAMRDLISLSSPVVFHNQSEPTVGVYGVEGSKPGAAAAAVWLAHRVIPPTEKGYGKILGQCLWTSKRLYCRLVTMTDSRFKITLFQMLPAERRQVGDAEIEKQKQYIRTNFVEQDNDALRNFLEDNSEARDLFMQMGSDQAILAYSFNFCDQAGCWNTDADRANALNLKIFDICSITFPPRDLNKIRLIVTNSSFDPAVYGRPFVDAYAGRLGVVPVTGLPIEFLISTTMDPWTTSTPKGDFLAVVEDVLRDAVHQALDDLNF